LSKSENSLDKSSNAFAPSVLANQSRYWILFLGSRAQIHRQKKWRCLEISFRHFLTYFLPLTNDDSQYQHSHCHVRHSRHQFDLNEGVEWYEDKSEHAGYSRTVDEQHEYRHDNKEQEMTKTRSQTTKPVFTRTELTRQPRETDVKSRLKIFNGLG
jgi:hypothetical protein